MHINNVSAIIANRNQVLCNLLLQKWIINLIDVIKLMINKEVLEGHPGFLDTSL